jgi:hypothetical protein
LGPRRRHRQPDLDQPDRAGLGTDATECTVTGDNWGPQTWYPNIRAAKAAVHERFPLITELPAHWSPRGEGQWMRDDGKLAIVQFGESWESFPFRLFNQRRRSHGAKYVTLAQAFKSADERFPRDQRSRPASGSALRVDPETR